MSAFVDYFKRKFNMQGSRNAIPSDDSNDGWEDAEQFDGLKFPEYEGKKDNSVTLINNPAVNGKEGESGVFHTSSSGSHDCKCQDSKSETLSCGEKCGCQNSNKKEMVSDG